GRCLCLPKRRKRQTPAGATQEVRKGKTRPHEHRGVLGKSQALDRGDAPLRLVEASAILSRFLCLSVRASSFRSAALLGAFAPRVPIARCKISKKRSRLISSLYASAACQRSG